MFHPNGQPEPFIQMDNQNTSPKWKTRTCGSKVIIAPSYEKRDLISSHHRPNMYGMHLFQGNGEGRGNLECFEVLRKFLLSFISHSQSIAMSQLLQ